MESDRIKNVGGRMKIGQINENNRNGYKPYRTEENKSRGKD